MYKTIFYSLLLLAVAFGGPISMFRCSDFWQGISKSVTGGNKSAVSGEAAESAAAARPVQKSDDETSLVEVKGTTPDSSMPSLEEVLRFDIAPAWVLQRWPRVSTDLAHLRMQGYRVPLVTGTAENDVAGSLTYYFNPAQQVQQITLRGSTGDPRALISLITSRYGYVRRPNNDPGRLVFESVDAYGKQQGSVIIQSAPVVRADQPHQRYNVDLIMNRPT